MHLRSEPESRLVYLSAFTTSGTGDNVMVDRVILDED